MNFTARFTLLVMGIFAAQNARSTIFLDLEEDSIPVLSLTVSIPVGFQAYTPEDSGVLNHLPEIFDQGSADLPRDRFNQELARFGASTSFSVGNEISTWELGLPFEAGRDYSRLISILQSQYQAPRFQEDILKLTQLKLRSALQGSLDSDTALASGTSARLRALKDFNSFPILLDSIDRVTLEKVRTAFNTKFHQPFDIWVGAVGPKSALPMIEETIKKVFPNAGEIKKGILKEALKIPARREFKFDQYKTAIIIERADRTQTITSFTWLKKGLPEGFSESISQAFGNYVLYGSGIGSYFGDEIRTKRGLAYAIGGEDSVYLGHSVVGVMTNPQRAREAEALEVFSEILKNGFEDASVFSLMSPVEWKTQFRSYQYDTILSERTAPGRLSRRQALVIGEMDPEMALKDPEDWKASQKATTDYYKKRFAGSSRILVVVGDPKSLKPIIEKAFPYYKIFSVPYKSLLQTSTLQKIASEMK
jgi:predicted Zn-dependent peptidase